MCSGKFSAGGKNHWREEPNLEGYIPWGRKGSGLAE